MFQLFLVNGISLILTDIETIILEQFLYNYPIPIIELKLSHRVGITNVNLSRIKTGKVRAVRFSTLAAICDALECQPGDILKNVEP